MKTKLFLLCSVIAPLLTAVPHSGAGAGSASARIEGTWTWDFTMPDGLMVSPKVTLQLDGEKLRGVAGFRPGTETAITEGRVNDGQISFEVVRDRDGRQIVTKYSGRVGGGTIRGKIESNWSGEWQTYDWLATKPVIPPNSVWNSLVPLPGNQKQRWKMRFRQQNDRLLGEITTSSGQKLDVMNGKVEGEEVSFDVERRRPNETNYFTYRGSVSGDRIEGSVLATVKGETQTLQWTAGRPARVVGGRWEWTFGGARRELVLERDGMRLTGKFIMDGKHEYEIEQGQIIGGEIYFEVERDRDAEKTLTKFRGTLGDDRIVGKTEFITDDAAPRFEDWQAEKVEPREEESNGNDSGLAPLRGKTRSNNRR
jgi:hypothetical protein